MATIQEFSYSKCPPSSLLSLAKEDTSIPGTQLMKPASGLISAAHHFTGLEGVARAGDAISHMGKGTDMGQWIQGNIKKSPFKERDIQKVKTEVSSLWDSFSSSMLAQAVVRTILIADSYLEYFSFLGSPDTTMPSVPYWDMIVPSAKLFSAGKKVFRGIGRINEAKNPHATERGYGTLITGATDGVNALAKLGAIYFLYQISPLAELVFMTGSYIGSMLELSQDQKTKRLEEIDAIVLEKPTIRIPV